jgi:glycosyltransferase involved in cell wall biosynthesis
MTSVLLVAPMPVGRQRTGPAIRYWELARVLSADAQVTLLVPDKEHPNHPTFAVLGHDEEDVDSLLARHEIVVVQGPAIQKHPQLAEVLAAGEHHLVVDLYDPITLEILGTDRTREMGRWLYVEYESLLNEQLRLGDFFLCASERQRDYWLGALAAVGRINPDTYDGSDLRHLIDVVPFGLPAQAPQASGPVLRGTLPGIEPSDRMILWGGGLWEWLDPLAPVRAMQQVAARHPNAVLVFFEKEQQTLTVVEQAKNLALETGLLGRQVVFADWLPTAQWEACLLEADIGLSFHPASLETHFAFRTRLLDYIWAGLPIVTATGDILGDLVLSQGLGHVVQPSDAEGLASALIALLEEPDARGARREAFHRVAEQFRWERVSQPLRRFCQQPWRAGDAESFGERWQAAQGDRALSDAAYAERRLADTQARLRALIAEHTQTIGRAEHLQSEVEGLTEQLRQKEAQLQDLMDGRVMRLMSGARRVLRHLGDPRS